MHSERLSPANTPGEKKVSGSGFAKVSCGLSPHEARVLLLVMDGHTLKTAAAKLAVSRATVAWYMRKIYEKLEVHSQSEAVAKAFRSGLIC